MSPPHDFSIRTDDDDTLLCPRCKDHHLRHAKTIVRNRTTEGSPGVRVSVEGQSATLEPEPANAGARDDIAIQFSCEGCGPGLALRIIQDKGQTVIRWDLP